MMEQYEKDKEIERLNKDVSRLEELLSVSETQYASVEQIVERLQERLNKCEEALVEAYYDCYNEGFEPDLAKEYLKKWGVK